MSNLYGLKLLCETYNLSSLMISDNNMLLEFVHFVYKLTDNFDNELDVFKAMKNDFKQLKQVIKPTETNKLNMGFTYPI